MALKCDSCVSRSDRSSPVQGLDLLLIRENRRNIRTAAFLIDYGEKQRENSCERGRFSVIGHFRVITPTKWRKVTV
ncbi:hypothetical protein FYJ75_14025 [Roseburia sp. MUC/MUC-530-WT-4D]|uniref:Uncharacterized protein n=1 Tax=Roseburia porci TaxID=2605790 RepID=A0A6L5YWF6_9FIRM|nr:hypothetical protein [Roseburia porci]MST76081.1 hypothetical protein [Roseburia porci]